MTTNDSNLLSFNVHRLAVVMPTGAYRFEYASINSRLWWVNCLTTGERESVYNAEFARNWCYDKAQALDAEARHPEPPSPAKAAPVPLLLPAFAASKTARTAKAKELRRTLVAVKSQYGHRFESAAPILLHSATESGALERFCRWMKACMPQQIDSILLDEREAAGEFEHNGDMRIETMRRHLWATEANLNARREAVRYLQAFGWSMDVNGRMFNVTAERLEREQNMTRVRALSAQARSEVALAA